MSSWSIAALSCSWETEPNVVFPKLLAIFVQMEAGQVHVKLGARVSKDTALPVFRVTVSESLGKRVAGYLQLCDL